MENNATGLGNEELPKVEDQDPIKNDEVPEDDYKSVDMIKDIHVIDIDNSDNKESIIMPSGTYNKITEMLESVNKLTKAEAKSRLYEKTLIALGTNIDSMRVTNTENMLVDTVNQEGFTNNMHYGSKELRIRPLPINSNGKALNGDAAIARLASVLGVGETTQVLLWHSGFWVTIKPIKEIDYINLEMQLSNNQISLGRDTNSLIFSNYSVVFIRILTDFIINNIQNYTLDISPDANIRNYIKVQDIYLLATGVLHNMHPNGYNLSKTCANSNNTDPETHVPLCSNIMSGKINFELLINVNRKALTTEHLKHVSKRNPNSVTLDEVLEYQNTLHVNKPKQVKITTVNGAAITLEICTPTLQQYIDNGEYWINSIIRNSEAIFTDTTTLDDKNRIINETSASVILNIYNIYVNKIMLEDGSSISGRADIDDSLGILSADLNVLKELIEAIKSYINTNTIAVAGIPNYVCPACNEEQLKDKKVPLAFKEIIPINVVESFFDLCVLRVNKAKSRSIY